MIILIAMGCCLQHASICDFPSEYFYKGKLRPDPSVNQRPPVKALQGFWPKGNDWPIVFCNVVGKEEERSDVVGESHKQGKTDPHSKCNPREAEKAVSHYHFTVHPCCLLH